MKIPLSWVGLFAPVENTLKQYGPKDLAHDYSIRTAEIEGIEVFGRESRVVVGKVLSTRPHPNSDHLNLVSVSVGALGERNIVCGATNVVGAKYIALATEGAILGEDFVIKQAKIRGEESQGMICSIDELGLAADRAEGILRLEDHFDEAILESRLGTPFYELEVTLPGINGKSFSARIQDTVFEIDNKFITNRPDLFSVAGNAREFSALYELPLSVYTPDQQSCACSSLGVKIETKKVLAYRLEYFRGATVGETPFGMAIMLHKAGLTVKNDLVDISNYIMTELGAPMHVFDADAIDGDVSVREARDGEKLLALDGKEYSLKAGDIVIADNSKILAIAGIIGGQSSAVSGTTQNICIEAAVFDAVSVRMTASRIGCRTDASTRFEKSQDPKSVFAASARARDFLSFLGKPSVPAATFEFFDESRVNSIRITTTHSFVARKLGRSIAEADVKRILEALGFTYSHISEDAFEVGVPSWRATKDISIEEDIVEEIGRVFGYDAIEESAIPGMFSIASRNASIELKQKTLDHFISNGFLEAYTYSFSNSAKDEAALLPAPGEDAIRIANAVSAEYTHMRRSIAPLLFSAASENLKHSSNFSFFEIGKVHSRLGENQFKESSRAAGIVIGSTLEVLRATLEDYLRKTLPTLSFSIAQGVHDAHFPFFHPNRSGSYSVNGEIIARFGYLHPEVVTNFELTQESLYFEIEYETISALVITNGEPKFREIPKFPGVERELNFVLGERTETSVVASALASVDARISGVIVQDIYRDTAKVGQDKKSVTFAFRIEDREKTLTDTEALEVQNRIIETLSKQGFELRK